MPNFIDLPIVSELPPAPQQGSQTAAEFNAAVNAFLLSLNTLALELEDYRTALNDHRLAILPQLDENGALQAHVSHRVDTTANLDLVADSINGEIAYASDIEALVVYDSNGNYKVIRQSNTLFHFNNLYAYYSYFPEATPTQAPFFTLPHQSEWFTDSTYGNLLIPTYINNAPSVGLIGKISGTLWGNNTMPLGATVTLKLGAIRHDDSIHYLYGTGLPRSFTKTDNSQGNPAIALIMFDETLDDISLTCRELFVELTYTDLNGSGMYFWGVPGQELTADVIFTINL